MAPTRSRGLFFISGGRRQIGGVNDGHGFATGRQERQRGFDQMFIDAAQAADSGVGAELMQHPHIRSPPPMTNPRKPPPRALLGKQADHGIETVRRGQQREQMNPPQLRRAEVMAAARMGSCGEEGVNELIWNQGRKPVQKLGRAGDWERRLHRDGLPEKTLPVAPVRIDTNFADYSLNVNRLLRIS